MVTATVTVTKDHTLTWLLAGPALLWSLQIRVSSGSRGLTVYCRGPQ